MQQHPLGVSSMLSVVDTSRTFGGQECVVDLDVVDAVAGEAVELVDDHVVDGVLVHIFEHALQFGSAAERADSPLSTNSSSDDRLHAQALRLLASRCAGMEKPSVSPPRFGLLLGGYPEVGDGDLGGEALLKHLC